MFVVAIGAFRPDEVDSLRAAFLRGRVEARFEPDAESAIRLLREASLPVPQGVFVDLRCPGLQEFIGWLRGEARLFSIPIVALADHVGDNPYALAHGSGADDVTLRTDMGGITRRAAVLADYDPTFRPPTMQGRAVVAHNERARRQILGRILRQAGFDLSFAADAQELVRVGQAGPPPTLVVAARNLPPEGADSVIDELRKSVNVPALPFIFLAESESRIEELGSKDGVAVTYETAPADNLIFLANELLRPDVKNVRASSRHLYGALCSFRTAGELHSAYGLTYNISREGLYVRTLDIPIRNAKVWLELRPPAARSAVHLRGTVVWTRGLMNTGGGASPPGFGLRIQPEACPPEDLASYEDGYRVLSGEPG